MTKRPAQKGIAHLGLIIVVVLVAAAAAFYFFRGEVHRFVGDVEGPPPSNAEERKEWFSERMVSMDKKMYVLDEKLPTWKELDNLNKSLGDRKYPDYIKALQTYNTMANLVEVMYFGDVLDDLGVNTEFVHANHKYRRGDFEYWYQDYGKAVDLNQDASKRALVHNILLARKLGLAVVLFPDYFELEDGGMNKLGISDDLEDKLEKIALDLAEIAEKYKVEYLVPVNQIEMILDSNGYDTAEAQKRTNDFYSRVVPKIKQIYSGKIMYKMGGFGYWSNYDGISLADADIFGFTGCHNSNRNSIEFVVNDTETMAKKADELSNKYGIPWFQAEFVVSDDVYQGLDSNPNAPAIEDYYKAGLEAFDEYGSNASGFTVHSLLTTGKIYDTDAYPLVKEFFATKP